jgi:hypothetical protein
MSPSDTSILKILRALSLFEPRMARVIDHHDMSRSAMWTRNTKRLVPVASKTPEGRFQPCIKAGVCLGALDVERHSFPV